MLSDDTYRAKLQQTIASVRAWSGFVADVARLDITDQGTAWRLALTPRAARACPVEFVLRSDQKYDLIVGGQTFEDRKLASLDLVLQLLQAVADGRVVTRRLSSAATGLLHGVETVVTLADGTQFKDESRNPAAQALNGVEIETREITYLPYRRGGG